MKITHLGTATLLIEVAGVRLLTDPVFDPRGTKHDFGFGFGSAKEYATAKDPDALGAIDAVLLSHDQHGDNLDASGREVMARAGKVITTRAARRRLGKIEGSGAWVKPDIVALTPFESTQVGGVRITGTPARHGPPLSLPIVGEVTGFVLEWEGQARGCVYITGDTVFYGGIEQVAAKYEVAIAIMHLGCASWGPLRFTMNAREGESFARAFPKARLVPVHYEGWSHFKESRGDVERVFASAGLTDRVTWLEPGVALSLDC